VVSAGTDRNAETVVVVPLCCAAASEAVRLASVNVKTWLAPIFRMVVPLRFLPTVDPLDPAGGVTAIAAPRKPRL
jgi:hypothetical protein